MPAGTPAPTEDAIATVIGGQLHLEGPLLPILHALQEAFGHVPQAALPTLGLMRDLANALVDDGYPPYAIEATWARGLGQLVLRLTGVQPSPDVVNRARIAQAERIIERFSGDERPVALAHTRVERLGLALEPVLPPPLKTLRRHRWRDVEDERVAARVQPGVHLGQVDEPRRQEVRPVEGVRDALGQRRSCILALAQFEISQRFLDLLAPGLLNAPGGSLHRMRLGCARHTALDIAFSGQQRIQEHPGNAADRDGRQDSHDHGLVCECQHVQAIASSAVLLASSAAASRFSSP